MMRNRDKIVLGLTGGSGVGKTTVATLLRDQGAMIIEADRVGHQVIQIGQPAYYKIIEFFGNDILQEDGQIDRKKLGRKVFTEPNSLRMLNEITHPSIKEKIQKQCEMSDNTVVVIDAALLFEVGLDEFCYAIWRVVAPVSHRIERIMNRDNLTYEEAMNRINAQIQTKENNSPVTLEITNEGDFKKLANVVECNLSILRGIGCD